MKILRAGAAIVSWLFLAVLLAFAVLLALSAFNLGVRTFVISSGSMSPAVPTGSVVFVRSASEYRVGDVITFSSNGGGFITHRIHEVREEGGRTIYTTKGDANDAPDLNPVEAERVEGRVVFHVPLIGYVTALFKTWPGAVLLLACLAAALAYLVSGARHKAGDAESPEDDKQPEAEAEE